MRGRPLKYSAGKPAGRNHRVNRIQSLLIALACLAATKPPNKTEAAQLASPSHSARLWPHAHAAPSGLIASPSPIIAGLVRQQVMAEIRPAK